MLCGFAVIQVWVVAIQSWTFLKDKLATDVNLTYKNKTWSTFHLNQYLSSHWLHHGLNCDKRLMHECTTKDDNGSTKTKAEARCGHTACTFTCIFLQTRCCLKTIWSTCIKKNSYPSFKISFVFYQKMDRTMRCWWSCLLCDISGLFTVFRCHCSLFIGSEELGYLSLLPVLKTSSIGVWGVGRNEQRLTAKQKHKLFCEFPFISPFLFDSRESGAERSDVEVNAHKLRHLKERARANLSCFCFWIRGRRPQQELSSVLKAGLSEWDCCGRK